MGDQLVSFETAKLAKEKGFSSKDTTTYYSINGVLGKTTYYESYSNTGGTDNSVYDSIPVECEAPTQSLLQKWLREKGWHVVINYDEQGWFYNTFHLAKPDDTFSPPTEGKSYEEVLEEGLVFLLNNL